MTFGDSSDDDMFAAHKKEPEKPKPAEKKTRKTTMKKPKKGQLIFVCLFSLSLSLSVISVQENTKTGDNKK